MTTNYEWNHGLGQIVTALIDAGLRIDFVHQHTEVPWQALPWTPSSPPPRSPTPSPAPATRAAACGASPPHSAAAPP